jgi:hypothetical protein
MVQKKKWELKSLQWIHQVREEHYLKTRNLPLESWLHPPDPVNIAKACQRMGLKVRLPQRKNVKVGKRAALYSPRPG